MNTPHGDHDSLDLAARLRSEPIELPPDLEQLEQTVLRRLGASPLQRRSRAVVRALAFGITALASLASGYALAQLVPTQARIAATHLLLLYEDDRYATPSTDRARERVQEYVRWARRLAADGRLESADELSSEGFVIDAPAPAASEAAQTPIGALTGYFLIRAADDALAQQSAAASPHMRHGGRVVVRPLGAP
jgi:hypothetical protein